MRPLAIIIAVSLLLGMYAAVLRLVAWFLSITRVSWLYGIQFGLLLLVISLLERGVIVVLGLALPIPLALLYGFLLHTAVGAWFFKDRAETAAGEPIGWRGGAKLAATTFAVFLVVAVGLAITMRRV